MAITNGYSTLAEARFHLGITTTSDTTNDAYIETTIEAVSRLIDNYCGRRFYVTDADEVRYFTPMDYDICFTDDIQTITKIEIDDACDRTYSVELETTDYDAYPLNFAMNGSPVLWLEPSPEGDYTFPVVPKGMKITGRFGYCTLATVPSAVKKACLIQSIRLFKRAKEAPFGVVGASDMGQATAIAKFDPDVELLLQNYKRLAVG